MAKSKYSDLSKTGENLTNLNSVVDSVLNIINTESALYLSKETLDLG